MINLYNECKDMPNPSKGLLKFFKRNPYKEIWGYRYSSNPTTPKTLKYAKELPLYKLVLRVGYPGDSLSRSKGAYIKARSFSGTELKQHMFTGRKCGECCLVGIGGKKGVWMINVTERLVKELQTVGACALSKSHCELELISPRVKRCKFCGRKLKKRIQVIRRVTWEKE